MKKPLALSQVNWLISFATFLAETEQDIDLLSAARIGERWYSGDGSLRPQAAATMYIALRKRRVEAVATIA